MPGPTRRLLLSVATLVIVLAAAPAIAASIERKVVASDGAAVDLFGIAVDIDGDTAVVGASEDDGSRGSIYVFERSGSDWTQTAKLTATDGAAGDALGSSVAIDGNTIVGGAVGDNGGAGSLYTFARDGTGDRQETAKLTATDGAALNSLGVALAIDSDKIVAGAPFGAGGGAVYTFDRTGLNPRGQTAKLTASDGGGNLGASVATDGDTIVAGAPAATGSRGAVYVFPGSGGNRFENAKLIASNAANGDQLGSSVAIQGATIVAGAGSDDVGVNSGQGSVYTFDRTGANPRGETAQLVASDGAPNDVLGASVAIDGETIVAGALRDDVGSNADQGSLYTFTRTGATPRPETEKLTSADGGPGDLLGISVAIDGDTVIGGASEDDVGANSAQGSVSVFTPASAVPPGDPPGQTPSPPGGTPDSKAPVLELTAKASQTAGKALKLTAGCDEACTLALTGSAKPKGAKKGKLKPVTTSLLANRPQPVKLKLGKLKKALKAAGKGKAKVAATATDAVGNRSQESLRIKLK